jgi:hypothetical protein
MDFQKKNVKNDTTLIPEILHYLKYMMGLEKKFLMQKQQKKFRKKVIELN